MTLMTRTKPTTPLTDTVFTILGVALMLLVIIKAVEGGCLVEPFNPTPDVIHRKP